jgi:hypothetical protein
LTFFATQGVRDDSWLDTDGDRSFKGHADIREALWHGWVATDAVQTMNRSRMRRVIDSEGNCAPTDVYMLLPRGPQGDKILAAIMVQLPGLIDIAEWNFEFQGRTRVAKASNVDYRAKLVAFAGILPEGARPLASAVRSELGCSTPTWERISAEMRDSLADLSIRLKALGVTYQTERTGSRTVAYITRSL